MVKSVGRRDMPKMLQFPMFPTKKNKLKIFCILIIKTCQVFFSLVPRSWDLVREWDYESVQYKNRTFSREPGKILEVWMSENRLYHLSIVPCHCNKFGLIVPVRISWLFLLLLTKSILIFLQNASQLKL